jgi:hypothetical protein
MWTFTSLMDISQSAPLFLNLFPTLHLLYDKSTSQHKHKRIKQFPQLCFSNFPVTHNSTLPVIVIRFTLRSLYPIMYIRTSRIATFQPPCITQNLVCLFFKCQTDSFPSERTHISSAVPATFQYKASFTLPALLLVELRVTTFVAEFSCCVSRL